MTSTFRARQQSALFLNGSSQYVQLPEDATLRPERTDAFSISGLVRLNPGSSGVIFGNPDASSVGVKFSVASSGKVAFELVNTLTTDHLSVETTSAVVNDGQVHNVLVTYDGLSLAAGVTIYIAGQSVTLTTVTNNLSASIVSTGTIAIGAFVDDSSEFVNGYLRDVQFYDYELTATDGARLDNNGRLFDALGAELSGADAFGYWRLEDNVVDSGTGGNGGILVGSAGFKNGVPVRPPSVAVGFNGTNQYGAIAHDASLTFADTTAYTVVAWTAFDGTDGGYVFSKIGATNRGWGVALTSDGRMQHFQNDDDGSGERQAQTDTGVFPTDNELHLGIWSYDGSQDVSGYEFSLDLVDAPGNTLLNTATMVYGASVEMNVAARSAGSGAQLKQNIAWVAVYSGVMSASDKAAIKIAGPYAPPPHKNRLLTTWFKNGTEQVVPAFPTDCTLNNGPTYRREDYIIPFAPGNHGEFLALYPKLGIILGAGVEVTTIETQGTNANNFTQPVALDKPELIAKDADYKDTASLDWDDVNTFMETILGKTAWAFMHDGTTEYIIHAVWKPGPGTQNLFSSQANTTVEVGFNLSRINATIAFSTSNGTAKVYDASATGWSDNDIALIQIHVNPSDVGNEIRIRIADDAEDVTAATGATPSTADAMRDAAYGSGGGGFTPTLATTSILSVQTNPSDQYKANMRIWVAGNTGVVV